MQWTRAYDPDSARLAVLPMPSVMLGELLIKTNMLNESQLKSALAEQKRWGGKLGEILVRMSLVTEDVLVKALSKQMAVPAANLETIQGIPPHVKAKIPANLARDLIALPLQLRDEGKTLVVAMATPQNLSSLDTLRVVSKCKIIPQIAGTAAIARAFARFYEGEADLSDFEGSFKVLDAQGRTVVKPAPQIEGGAPPGPPTPPVGPPVLRPTPPPAAAPRVTLGEIPVARASVDDPRELLRSVEDVQRREVAVLKAMVELLIEKGVFTRDEYVAKVKR
jgi:hypothetical protein